MRFEKGKKWRTVKDDIGELSYSFTTDKEVEITLKLIENEEGDVLFIVSRLWKSVAIPINCLTLLRNSLNSLIERVETKYKIKK